jgi:hypothetical protein
MSACSKVPEDGETGRRAPQTDDTNRAYGAAKRLALSQISSGLQVIGSLGNLESWE